MSKGMRSSRETARTANSRPAIRLVIAASIEKIYKQNAQNIGLLTSTDFGLLERIRCGEAIPIDEFLPRASNRSAPASSSTGALPYNKARMSGQVSPPRSRHLLRAK